MNNDNITVSYNGTACVVFQQFTEIKYSTVYISTNKSVIEDAIAKLKSGEKDNSNGINFAKGL